MKDAIRDFFQDYGKYVYIGLGAVIIIFFTWIVLTDNGGEVVLEGEEEVINAKEMSEELSGVFSEFSKYQIAPSNQMLAYEVNLYLKDPFISKGDLERELKKYVDLMKWKTNNKRDKTYLLGLRINIYDRERVYLEDLSPRGVATYMLREEDKKKMREEDEFMQETDMRWEHTLSQDKEPDYDKYRLSLQFNQYSEVTGVVPLSDEEFDFYLKLSKYSKVQGSSITGGIHLYLEWDLGRNISQSGILRITKEFDEFVKRHTAIGGQQDYYSDVNKLKAELAVNSPRFLVYALTKEIVDDKTLAKRRLIAIDANFYLDVFLQDAQDKLASGDFDTSSQDALDGGELDDEEWGNVKESGEDSEGIEEEDEGLDIDLEGTDFEDLTEDEIRDKLNSEEKEEDGVVNIDGIEVEIIDGVEYIDGVEVKYHFE